MEPFTDLYSENKISTYMAAEVAATKQKSASDQ